MKSLQTKIVSLTLCCILFSVLMVEGAGLINTRKTLNADSLQIMELLCAERTNEINESIRNVEQSVNTLYRFALELMGDADELFENEEELDAYITDMRDIARNIAENTEGAIAIYYRFNPELSTSVQGIYLANTRDFRKYEDQQPTDLSLYSKDDVGHVGWYYMPLEARKAVWMNPYFNTNIDVEMISYVVPIYKDGITIGVIGMDIPVELLRKQVKSVSVYESGNAFLVDKAGNIIYHEDYPDGIKKEEFNEELKDLKEVLKEAQETKDIYTYRWKHEKRMIVTQKIQNGMTLAITVPVSEVNAPQWELIWQSVVWVTMVMILSYLMCREMVKGIVRPLKQLTEAAKKIANGNMEVTIECDSKDEVGVLAQSFRQTAKSLKEYITYINRLAYTDVMTGARNKAAYEDIVSWLNKEIENGKAEFAVVVMDINNLKLINDTYGHEEGDKLISDAASVMKKVFGELNVFRVGGDEFVIILQLMGRMRYQELMKEFAKELESYNMERKALFKLQIARGVSVYEKGTDQSFSDVFRKADLSMYSNKKSQKSLQN